jgi:hypothetical protein
LVVNADDVVLDAVDGYQVAALRPLGSVVSGGEVVALVG